MQRIASYAAVLSLIALAACANTAATEAPPASDFSAANGAETEMPAEPSLEDLVLAKATARWRLIEDDDWIGAYDYNLPEHRDLQSLSEYLDGAAYHHYQVTEQPRFVAERDSELFVWVRVDWTPTHPELDQGPQAKLTQSIAMIETWEIVDDEIFFATAVREADFRNSHADLFEDAADAGDVEPN